MIYLGAFLLLALLILVHEAGHLAAAKLAGIPVAGFSVGFGPKLWSRDLQGTEYALRAIPLGGFVLPAAQDPDEFQALPLARRLVFFLGGPAANLVLAVLLVGILNAGAPGASLQSIFWAPFVQVSQACMAILLAISALFASPEHLSGIIGIVKSGGDAAVKGEILSFTAGLSLSLAILNLLPIPILDGGQILLGCMERLFPRFTRLRVPLTVLGMVVLASLMIYANVKDVVRLWS